MMPEGFDDLSARRSAKPPDQSDLNDLKRWYMDGVPDGGGERFDIAIVMAGAISAGAYTAGVMDFLFESLDAWTEQRLHEDHKVEAGEMSDAERTVPPHQVRLRIITGASAGGINGAIAAAAAELDFPHVSEETEIAASDDNPFYRAWVKDIDITKLLTTEDLSENENLVSLLNSGVLSRIAGDIVNFPKTHPDLALPEEARGKRSWLGDDFRLDLTVTNLQGVPYEVRFTNDTGFDHEMILHRDHMSFAAPLFGEVAADSHGPDVLPLPRARDMDHDDWRLLARTALATAAFPLALEPRKLLRPTSDYDYRYLYVTGTDQVVWARPWPDDDTDEREEPFGFVNVDGGAMNNEPFEMARRHLAGQSKRNPREGEKATRAVLMIDPFVEARKETPDRSKALVDVVMDLFKAFKSQSRFNQFDLTLAIADDVYSRFLIAPKRNGTSGDRAIASGGLGAFLGFFSSHYRRHDYFLGRSNCQQFLRDWFVLPERNPLVQIWPEELRNDQRYRSRSPHRSGHHQIIPLVAHLQNEQAPTEWPRNRFTGSDRARVATLLETRVDTVKTVFREEILRRLGLEGLVKWLARQYLKIAVNRAAKSIKALAMKKIDEAVAKINSRQF